MNTSDDFKLEFASPEQRVRRDALVAELLRGRVPEFQNTLVLQPVVPERVTTFFVRGEFALPGESVEPDVPSVLPPLSRRQPVLEGTMQARQARLRLEAEIIHDSALAVGTRCHQKSVGRASFPFNMTASWSTERLPLPGRSASAKSLKVLADNRNTGPVF